jgi:hypothetical protein
MSGTFISVFRVLAMNVASALESVVDRRRKNVS